MYIVRVDIDDPGCAGTHGWQVRYERPGTQFFSDSRFDHRGHKGTACDSLYAAKLYLQAIWKGRRPRRLPPESPSKAGHTGMTGVRIVWRERKGTSQCSIRVDDLTGKPLANLYVGTTRTATDDRLLAQLAAARRIRADYLVAAGAAGRLPGCPT
ncbi:hypothetical protein [Ottowia sp.]|uniref:hypothetical protein n=1 Tax=Ottowia sp. TaxID=1898956 RepID=UPI0025FC5178|nr:hypothetical protein [Ottowia sp.]MBK6616283.1 hypothetical protein [Ottowia sp.]